jgi:hypothetical protein
MIAKDPRASESTHWYTRDGEPMYTVIGKTTGRPRNTTLRDARELNLVPSVTTILNITNKPALTAWLQQQAIMAALTLPRADDEPEKQWLERVIHDSKAEGKAAADKGTEIHEAVQGFYEGKKVSQHHTNVMACVSTLRDRYGNQDWICERSFSHELGFGGKCDLHAFADEQAIVVDIKTKDFSDLSKVEAYDENLMQLAAYRVGLGIPKARCANIFSSRTHPELACIKEWTEEELQKGWAMFCALLRYWQIKNNYQ